jgi:hypothetical protein
MGASGGSRIYIGHVAGEGGADESADQGGEVAVVLPAEDLELGAFVSGEAD